MAPILAVVAAVLILSACNNVGCTENRSSIPLAGFYSMTDGKAIQLNFLNIGGVKAPNDSLLLKDGEMASQVFLPFRQTASQAKFFIAYKTETLDFPELIDTITFDYESQPYFVSEDCGAMLRYRITKVAYTKHILDSVGVIPADSMIINIEQEYLKLFFRTAEADDEGGEAGEGEGQ